MGRVIALYVAVMVSLSLPHCEVVRALIMLSDLEARSLVSLMCSEKVNLGSKVRPRIFGFLQVGMG